MRSFTLSLRYAYKDSPISIREIVPPCVVAACSVLNTNRDPSFYVLPALGSSSLSYTTTKELQAHSPISGFP